MIFLVLSLVRTWRIKNQGKSRNIKMPCQFNGDIEFNDGGWIYRSVCDVIFVCSFLWFYFPSHSANLALLVGCHVIWERSLGFRPMLTNLLKRSQLPSDSVSHLATCHKNYVAANWTKSEVDGIFVLRKNVILYRGCLYLKDYRCCIDCSRSTSVPGYEMHTTTVLLGHLWGRRYGVILLKMF